jgi:hypothetical protein
LFLRRYFLALSPHATAGKRSDIVFPKSIAFGRNLSPAAAPRRRSPLPRGAHAILNTAPLQREAHVRAAIVEGEDAAAVVHDKDRTMPAVQNEPALRL